MESKCIPIDRSEVVKYRKTLLTNDVSAEHIWSGHMLVGLPEGVTVQVRAYAGENQHCASNRVVEILYRNSTIAYLHTGYAPEGALRITDSAHAEKVQAAIDSMNERYYTFTDDKTSEFTATEAAARIAAKLPLPGDATETDYRKWDFYPDWETPAGLDANNATHYGELLHDRGLYLVGKSDINGSRNRSRNGRWEKPVDSVSIRTYNPGHASHDQTLAFILINAGPKIHMKVSAPDVVALVRSAIAHLCEY